MTVGMHIVNDSLNIFLFLLNWKINLKRLFMGKNLPVTGIKLFYVVLSIRLRDIQNLLSSRILFPP